MKHQQLFPAILVLTVSFALGGLALSPHKASAEVRPIIFPVIGNVTANDDFGAPRIGHTHEGNDILGRKGLPLIAAVNGEIRYAPYPEASYGYAVYIDGDDGYIYAYLHVNNDTPGTDDGKGGGMNAYAPDIERGKRVVAGQFIGWMGDSGNAENTTPHLHFEIRTSENTAIDPHPSLLAATHISTPAIPPALDGEFLPFGQFTGGASIARGEVFPDTAGEELVVGAGSGGGPHVKVFATDKTLLSEFFAFPLTFRGGVDIATGDFNADGTDEIVAGAGPGGGAQVRIFTSDGKAVGQFLAFPATFRGGVRVAAADLDGDGIDEIVVSAGPGGGPQVRIFRANGELLGQFYAYAPAFRNGVYVTATDWTATSPAMIITGAGRGGGPQVRVFDIHGNVLSQFFVYATDFRGGVRVDTGNVRTADDAPEIVTIPASGGNPLANIFSLQGTLVETRSEFEIWWFGGYDIAASSGTLDIVSFGGRRASIRPLIEPPDFHNFF